MPELPHVLIFPGWYPSIHHPFSGDFVKYQAQLLYKKGLSLSIINLDLDYRFLFGSPQKWLAKTEMYKDDAGINHYTERGFYPPKFNSVIIENWAKHFLFLYEKYRSYWPEKHIIHAHNYLGGLGAYFVREKYGVPYIITEHSTSFLEASVPSHHHRVIKKSLNHASKIIAVSNALKKKLETWTKVPVTTIPNFIDTNLFSPTTEKFSSFTFIYAGDLISRKNISLLIDAFHLLSSKIKNEVHLRIAGDGPLRNTLMRQVNALKLTDRVSFIGQLTQGQLVSVLQKSHALILPSFQETFGLVLVEAMSCGIPVISTPSGGPIGIINKDIGVLLKNYQKESLCSAMTHLFTYYHSYNADVIRNTAIRNYSVDAILINMKTIYSNMKAK